MKHFYAKNKVTICKVYKILIGNVGLEVNVLNFSKIEKEKQFKRTISLIIMGIFCLTSVKTIGALSRNVTIEDGKDTISLQTLSNDTDKILKQANVNLSANDVVERNDLEDGSLKININRALNVKVIKGDKVVELKEQGGKVKDAIADSKIELTDTDIINFPQDAFLEPNMEIVIENGVKISLICDGEEKQCVVPDKTVEEAIKYLDIELSQNDIVSVDLNAKVKDNPNIKISRVIYREEKKTEDIPFNTIRKSSSLLDNTEQQVQTPGKIGSKEVVYKEKLIDGEIVSSEVLSSEIVSEPVDEVVLVGTKLKPVAVKPSTNIQVTKKSEPTNTDNEFKMIVGCATAYTADKGARTSTGAVPVEGKTVAVNPKLIPYGSTVIVKNLNDKVIFQGVAQDTGGALMKNTATVDIFKTSYGRCINFGRQRVKVYFRA